MNHSATKQTNDSVTPMLNTKDSSFLLDGVLLLEHSSVDQFMPLLTICSTMPSRVDADVEGLNIFRNSSQPSFSRTSSWSSHDRSRQYFSCRTVFVYCCHQFTWSV